VFIRQEVVGGRYLWRCKQRFGVVEALAILSAVAADVKQNLATAGMVFSTYLVSA